MAETYNVYKSRWEKIWGELVGLEPKYWLGGVIGIAVLQTYIPYDWLSKTVSFLIYPCLLMFILGIMNKNKSEEK